MEIAAPVNNLVVIVPQVPPGPVLDRSSNLVPEFVGLTAAALPQQGRWKERELQE
jgi:hypothetical protein